MIAKLLNLFFSLTHAGQAIERIAERLGHEMSEDFCTMYGRKSDVVDLTYRDYGDGEDEGPVCEDADDCMHEYDVHREDCLERLEVLQDKPLFYAEVLESNKSYKNEIFLNGK